MGQEHSQGRHDTEMYNSRALTGHNAMQYPGSKPTTQTSDEMRATRDFSRGTVWLEYILPQGDSSHIWPSAYHSVFKTF